jgi:hypothetical protein
MQSNCQKSSIMNISHTLKWVWNKLFLSCDVVKVIESLATWLNMMDSYFLPRFEVIWITITLFNCKNLDIRKFVFTKLFIHLQTNKQLWVCIPLGQGVSDTTFYVIKFVSDLWHVGGFLRVLWYPPPIKLTARM